MTPEDKKNINPQYFTKHILPAFIFINPNNWDKLDLKVAEELEQDRININNYQKITTNNNIRVFQIKQDKKVNVPELYIQKNQINFLLHLINSLPQDIDSAFSDLKKTRDRFQLLEDSIPPTQKNKHAEYQELTQNLIPMQQMGKAILFYLNQKVDLIDQYKKQLKKEKQKSKSKKEKELLKEWVSNVEQYHDLFPVARKLQRKVKLFIGPTNSGKTYNALNELIKHEHGVYLAPLRLLALEGKEEIENRGHLCSFITGEEKEINENAKFVAQTIETFNYHKIIDAVLIDEVQMIADENRGWAWSQALIGAPAKNIILTGSLDCRDIISDICAHLGDELEIIDLNRFTNLEICSEADNIIGDKIKQLEESTAIIVFSRKSVLKYKYYFEKANLPVSIIYGNLSPEVRREEARKFRSGETKFLISTDAIAMGLNLPIKKVIFAEVLKFNGKDVDFISPNEVRQIAGRAGRFGKFDVGYVSALSDRDLKFIKHTIKIPNKIENIIFVRPNLDQVLLLSQLLNEDKLSLILDKYYRLIKKQEDIYQCADLEQIKMLTFVLDNTDLSLEDKFFWSSLPIDTNTIECLNIFKEWVNAYARNKDIPLNLPFVIPDVASNNFSQDFLYKAEINIKILTAFAWIAQHFPEKIKKHKNYKELKNKFNEYIIACLNHNIAERKCPECNKVLSIDHSHKICDDCYFGRKY